MITFEEFVATSRDVDDVSEVASDEDVRPGRVYANDLFIESSMGHPDGAWMLVWTNQCWLSNDVHDLELRLYDLAVSEGDLS
jgi:hypothetical protein